MPTCPSCGHKNAKNAVYCVKCASPLVVGKDPFIGIVIDKRYEVVSRIADGGMGTVYRGWDTRLEKDIALKILHPELARDKKFLSRFRNEALTVAQLKHPNIALVYDTGPVRDTYYIAMDFIQGQDLVDLIKKKKKLMSVEEAVSIAIQVAEGLAYAHERGVLHRDIKPGNIIVDKSGRAVITDFGIAKALGEKGQTTTGTAVGTPEYMSLEQVKGLELDERTDIYSLGVVLYEMLTRQSPFRADTSISTVAKILSEDPPPVERLREDLPGWVVALINKAISKNRDDRIRTADEFITAAVGELGKKTKSIKVISEADDPAVEVPRTRRAEKVVDNSETPEWVVKLQKWFSVGNRKFIIAASFAVFVVVVVLLMLTPFLTNTRLDSYKTLKDGMYSVKVNGKWGYADKVTLYYGMKTGYGHIIIPPRFDEVSDFNEGIARVKVGKTYGYINRQGDYIANPQYDSAGFFREGMAYVKVGSKLGYIDKTGRYIIRPRFDSAGDFKSGRARVTLDNKWWYIGVDGEPLPSECHSSESSAWGYISEPEDSCEFKFYSSKGRVDYEFTCNDPSVEFGIKFIDLEASGKEFGHEKNIKSSYSGYIYNNSRAVGSVKIIVYSNNGSGSWKWTWK